MAAEGYRTVSRHRVPYGVVTSHVFMLEPSGELELTFAGLGWADTAPIDPGTATVVRVGFRILIDKDGLLRRVADAIAR